MKENFNNVFTQQGAMWSTIDQLLLIKQEATKMIYIYLELKVCISDAN